MAVFATNSWQAREALATRVAYRTYGSMYAVAGPTLPTGHRLPIEWQRQYLRDEPEIVYTVVSYRTPIAWVKRDGTVVKVDHKWSVTTTGHQGMLYALNPSVETLVGIANAAARERQAQRDRAAQRREAASQRFADRHAVTMHHPSESEERYQASRPAAHQPEVFGGMRSTPEDYDALIGEVQGMLVR